MTPQEHDGIVGVPITMSVDDAIDRLRAILEQKHIALFARVDHSGEAHKAGLAMRPTKSLIFGNLTGLFIAIGLIAISTIAMTTRGADVPYPQFVREFYQKDLGNSAQPVTSVAVGSDGSPWVVVGGRLVHKNGDRWEQIQNLGIVNAVIPAAEALPNRAPSGPGLLAAGNDGVWQITGEHMERERESPRGVDVLIRGSGSGILAIVNSGPAKGIWERSAGWKKLCDLDPEAGNLHGLCQLDSGQIFASGAKGAFKVSRYQPWMAIKNIPGAPQVSDLSQIFPLGAQHAMFLTHHGVSLTNNAVNWQGFTGKDGLPIESLSVASCAGDSVWLGSDQGAILWRHGQFTYFAGPRWLPDDHVTAIAATAGDVWIATRAGLAHITEQPMTLKEKAVHYQRMVEDRPRRQGYVTVMHLKSPGDFKDAEQEISDNDGLWTAMYVAAECFRYAATHDPAARDQARKSMQALLRLESITGISGFPARAISNIHDPAHERRSGGQWHPSSVEKDWMWKGDTSSDEIVGHYLAFYLYSTLVADDQEKRQIQATCRRITDHILDHGYYLIDITGKPTTWGYWSPERLNSGRGGDRGLNSLEILSHLKVAIQLLGDDRYKAAYEDLIEKHHYALNTIGQRISFNGRANHSDDELAFLSYYPLLILETDPALRSIYQASLRRTWDAVRPESCPLWNFIYGACTGEACDTDLAVGALRDIPLDLVHWPTANARRADLKFDPTDDRFGRKQLLRPLNWIERPLHKWNNNPYELDGGGGTEEEDPTFWLLPYWMGEFHHLLN